MQPYRVLNDGERNLRAVMLCAARNALARLPKYESLRYREPYIDVMNERIHFDIN